MGQWEPGCYLFEAHDGEKANFEDDPKPQSWAPEHSRLRSREEQERPSALEMGTGPAAQKPAVLDRNHTPRRRSTRDGDLGTVAGRRLLLQHRQEFAQGEEPGSQPALRHLL